VKKCIYCAEYVQEDAVVCRHCGRDLAETVPLHLARTPYTQRKPAATKLAAILFLVAACSLLFLGMVLILLVYSSY